MRTSGCLAFSCLALSTAWTPAWGVTLQRGAMPDGATFLAVIGEFLPRENVAEALIREVAGRPVAFVTFDSSGGNPYTAMQLGRAIRVLGLSTAEVRPLSCVSACALAFLGGTNRFAEAGVIGVHKTAFTPEAQLSAPAAVSAVQTATADILRYIGDMGVDPALLQVAFTYESDDMRYLSVREMEELKVVNTSPLPEQERRFTGLPGLVGVPFKTSPPDAETARGVVRHPSGGISLLSRPDEQSAAIIEAWNGTPIEVLGFENHWYRIRCRAAEGYAHDSWVRIDGFASADDDRKYIQIFSYPSVDEARAKALALPYKTDIFAANNGWFALTLRGKFDDQTAREVMARARSDPAFPADAFATFGNTYQTKICCNAESRPLTTSLAERTGGAGIDGGR